jgi:hypothetical protein
MTIAQLIETVNSQSPSLEEIMRVDGENEEMAEKIRSSFLLKFEGSENTYPTLIENLAKNSNIFLSNSFGGIQFNYHFYDYLPDLIEFASYAEDPIVMDSKTGEISFAYPISWDVRDIHHPLAASEEHFWQAMLYLNRREVEARYRDISFAKADVMELIKLSGGEKYWDWWNWYFICYPF